MRDRIATAAPTAPDPRHRVIRLQVLTIVSMAVEAAIALGEDCFLSECGQPLVLRQRPFSPCARRGLGRASNRRVTRVTMRENR
jgi:hypothetical protein